jgi:hypothetical protein
MDALELRTLVEVQLRPSWRRKAARRRAATRQGVPEPVPAVIATNFIGEHEIAKKIDRDIRTVRRWQALSIDSGWTKIGPGRLCKGLAGRGVAGNHVRTQPNERTR